MPRRQLLIDIDKARADPPGRIYKIRLEDDENIAFEFILQTQYDHLEINLKLIPTNVDGYPANSGYILFTDDNDVDENILSTLEVIQNTIDKAKIPDALEIISSSLERLCSTGLQCKPLRSGDHRPQSTDCSQGSASNDVADSPAHFNTEEVGSQNDDNGDDDGNDDNDDSDVDLSGSDFDSDRGFGFADSEDEGLSASRRPQSSGNAIDISIIKADLLATKQAGFRIGVYGKLSTGGMVCISIRISKLGISDEALKAWSIGKHQYLILLMRFRYGYRTLSMLPNTKNFTEYVEMRVGLCESYKPSFSAATETFEQVKTSDLANTRQGTQGQNTIGAIQPLFIGKAINDVLRNRFAQIVHYRSLGLSWAGAEQVFNEIQGSVHHIAATIIEKHLKSRDNPLKRALPPIVMSDVLKKKKISEAPLTLVAMQFVLRHFVRCTEFCLVCHCKTDDTFEALKPYVCSKPLCLYQFFSYGFGPLVEYEIISQPYVVDLLVSLCFSQAAAQKIDEMPQGLRLRVPVLPNYVDHNAVQHPTIHTLAPRKGEKKASASKETSSSFTAKWSPQQNQLKLSDDAWINVTQLRGGEWVTVIEANEIYHHFRVRNVLQPYIFLSDCINPFTGDTQLEDLPLTSELWVDCYLFDQEFDDISKHCQHKAILTMLGCLPGVLKIRDRLLDTRHEHGEASLQALKEIPPAARDLLRWIIASNRSCIMQVDPFHDKDDTQEPRYTQEFRVSGMQDWIQFRFAQGAPDKEQRFIEAVRHNTVNLKSPTLFAWHGSPIHNWHSIIRQGLNFDVIAHGRANGNGVYMSPHLQTSLGFTSIRINPILGSPTWANSVLKASQVVSLQEFVNAPDRFVCHNPHFVVAQKEWIQTRYLFVKTAKREISDPILQAVYVQDPRYLVHGEDGAAIKIPITAVSRSIQGLESIANSTTPKKRKIKIEASCDVTSDDDIVSVASLVEDLCWLGVADGLTDSDRKSADIGIHNKHAIDHTCVVSPSSAKKRRKGNKNYILDSTRTNFVPSTLDLTNIAILPTPPDATPSASKALMKSLSEALQTQSTTPLHELGFYIDQDTVENIYQWVIELHSFDKGLPLAQDLQKAGLTSVVLEMRFSNQFPFAPPFVRVVRPRFLPFASGGGGHVTEGGAICMELLTTSGWSAVLSIESILLQIKLAMCEKERPARLSKIRDASGRWRYDVRCYDIGEAVVAFRRACSKHGWKVPDSLNAITKQS